MKRIAVIVAALGAPAILLAQTAPTDFARGATIRTEGGTIFRVTLPDDVYDTVTRADLGDVRVLNAAGEVVPHTVREAPRPKDPEAEWTSVPAFPLSDIQAGGTAKTQVRVGPDGAVLEVTNDPTVRQGTTAYLVDATAIKEEITRLELFWEAAPDVTFVAHVNVQASENLNTWRTIVGSAALAQLQRDGQMLTQREIELPDATRTKYLRVSWPKDLAAVTLSSIRVRPRVAEAEREIRWRALTAQSGDTAGSANYDTRAYLPVQYVDLEFPDPTDAATVTLRSRPSESADWQLRHAGLFYSLRESNDTIRGKPARIAMTTHRYWTLETTRERGWVRAPQLRVGWHPHELVFLAQGAGPYTLVYGNARIEAADAPVEALLAAFDDAERERRTRPASLDTPRSLGGADALTPPRPLKQIALWSVLIVAVGMLAFLAARVMRDAKQ
jgi:hypothetical protein